MGAGNRYTLIEDNSVLAFQLDVSCSCWESEIYDCDCQTHDRDALIDHILEMEICKRYGLTDSRDKIYYGEMFMITFESNHNGDAIVINFEYQSDFENEGLQEYHYSKAYHKLIRHINKAFPLFVGYGYTSGTYAVKEFTKAQ